MTREELTEAIHDMADSPHMRQHALEHAMGMLDLEHLAQLFDAVADHHALLHPVARRRVPRNAQLGDQPIKTAPALPPMPYGEARLCAHADEDGRGAHWLGPNEVCPYAR